MAEMYFNITNHPEFGGRTFAALYSPGLRTFYGINLAFYTGLLHGEFLEWSYELVHQDHAAFRRLNGAPIKVSKRGSGHHMDCEVTVRGLQPIYGGVPILSASASIGGRPFNCDGVLFRWEYQQGMRFWYL